MHFQILLSFVEVELEYKQNMNLNVGKEKGLGSRHIMLLELANLSASQ